VVRVRSLQGMRLHVETPTGNLFIDRRDDGTEELRPVDLLVASLGGCMLGTMLEVAKARGIDPGAVSIDLEPKLASRPLRVESIDISLCIPPDVDEKTADELLRIAKHCKIHNTLQRPPSTEVTLRRIAAV